MRTAAVTLGRDGNGKHSKRKRHGKTLNAVVRNVGVSLHSWL